MVKNLMLACLVIVLAAGLTFGLNAYFKSEKGDFFILEDGKTVPDFSFETLDGKNYKFSDFNDNRVVIHFWASWCPPCVVEFPDIVSFARDNPNTKVLAISSDRTEQAINRFLNQYAPDVPDNFLIIHDADNSLTQGKFSVFKLPESFLIGQDGVLENHIVGAYGDWSSF